MHCCIVDFGGGQPEASKIHGGKKRNYFHFIKKWKKKVYFLKLVKKNSVHELDKIRFICFHILKHL